MSGIENRDKMSITHSFFFLLSFYCSSSLGYGVGREEGCNRCSIAARCGGGNTGRGWRAVRAEGRRKDLVYS